MSRPISFACALVCAFALVFGSVAAASATVSSAPASWTPSITSTDSQIRQLVQCGSTMYAVGSFSQVAQGGTTYARANAFSFSATTGAVSSWNPGPNGVVNSVALSADCSTAYLGGVFTSVGGTAVKNVVAVDTQSGSVRSTFAHNANGAIRTLALVANGTQLLAGGGFTSINGTASGYYASLDPGSGKVTSYLSAAVAGKLPGDGATMVFNQQVSAQGDRLLFEGDFTTIAGQPRLQLAELDLTASSATLDPWYDQTLNTTYCSSNEEFYVRAAAFSPDEQTIYAAATGYQGSSPYCDAVTAFTNTAPATVKWSNKTGGDSLYAVAAGPDDVYIGGHERWADNPQGSDSCGAGCVSRPGLGDISASAGTATSWNPTRDRGKGADDLLITSAGLWVASDTFYGAARCGGVSHPGICFLPGTA